ncbi:MAG: hypothetical protein NZ518_00050 [Dehalococcoidia bacterium]|nr:hypothetical protein [Dehalococcoidia bacterium]
MTVGELIQLFRLRADDAMPPYLWGDEEIQTYLDEAQREAAIRGRLLREVTDAEAVDGTIELDDEIIELVAVIVDGRHVTLTDSAILDDRFGARWRGWEGRAIYGIRDGHALRLVPRPPGVTPCVIEAYRAPRSISVEPEIPPEWHERLLDWVLFRAYTKADSEARNEERAIAHLRLFEAAFGPRPPSWTERRVAEARPPVVRSCWP